MNNYVEVDPLQLSGNPFHMIGTEWMLVTAKHQDKVNTMTASWGGLGIMWNKNVAFVVLRPERYTKEFVDNSDTYSLTFFDDSYRKTLGYLGRVSGRDEDKILKSGLTVGDFEGTPYFEEAKTVIICKKLFLQNFDENCFLEKQLVPDFYPAKNFHTLYIGEITKILTKNP